PNVIRCDQFGRYNFVSRSVKGLIPIKSGEVSLIANSTFIIELIIPLEVNFMSKNTEIEDVIFPQKLIGDILDLQVEQFTVVVGYLFVILHRNVLVGAFGNGIKR